MTAKILELLMSSDAADFLKISTERMASVKIGNRDKTLEPQGHTDALVVY